MNARTIRCNSVLSLVLSAALFGGFSTGCSQAVDEAAPSGGASSLAHKRPSGIAAYAAKHGAHGQPLASRMMLPSSSAIRGSGTPLPDAPLAPEGPALWTQAIDLVTPRSGPTSVTLVGNNVLIVGGTSSSTILATSEIYNPVDGTTTTTGAMAQGRFSHTTTRMANGEVLAAGGWDADDAIGTAEIYNPVTGVWRSTTPMNHVRAEHQAIAFPVGHPLVGKILVIGGAIMGNGVPTAELYDPATETWTDSTLVAPRGYFTASLLPNGKVLAVGGWSDSVADMSTSELYNPATNTWSATTGSLSVGRDGHAAVVLPGGKVLVAGGEAEDYSPLASAEVYDSATDSWTSAGNMANAHVYHTMSVLPDGRVLAVGGYETYDTISGSADAFTPGGGTWATAPSMITRRTFASAATLPSGRLLVLGGSWDPGMATASIESFGN